MKTCEDCKKEITIVYGSGRFCSAKCARSFSTKNKRQEINEKVSKSLTGRVGISRTISEEEKERRRNSWTNEHRKKASDKRKKQSQYLYENTPFPELSIRHKKRYILEQQGGKCLFCSLKEWLGIAIKFELDHIDGNKKNNDLKNLRCLCPNCHSTTPTWRKKKNALVDKLVKLPDLDSGECVGSNPTWGTKETLVSTVGSTDRQD